ncbi:hypothetical protein G6F32_015965 [Rhizopus arrhizus]|nr:hypothetical protein G6F32_015965 [Rhizopus arrhizus]
MLKRAGQQGHDRVGVAVCIALDPAGKAHKWMRRRDARQFCKAQRPQVTYFEDRARAEFARQCVGGQEHIRMRAGSHDDVRTSVQAGEFFRMQSHLQRKRRHVKQSPGAVTLRSAPRPADDGTTG